MLHMMIMEALDGDISPHQHELGGSEQERNLLLHVMIPLCGPDSPLFSGAACSLHRTASSVGKVSKQFRVSCLISNLHHYISIGCPQSGAVEVSNNKKTNKNHCVERHSTASVWLWVTKQHYIQQV